MNYSKIGFTLIYIALVTATNAADIAFAGYLLNRSDWRNPAASKHEPATNQNLDLDADGILGSQGYILFGPAGQEIGKSKIDAEWLQQVTKNQPDWIKKIEILSPAEMARFSGYAAIDHPETAGGSFVSGALSMEN